MGFFLSFKKLSFCPIEKNFPQHVSGGLSRPEIRLLSKEFSDLSFIGYFVTNDGAAFIMGDLDILRKSSNKKILRFLT